MMRRMLVLIAIVAAGDGRAIATAQRAAGRCCCSYAERARGVAVEPIAECTTGYPLGGRYSTEPGRCVRDSLCDNDAYDGACCCRRIVVRSTESVMTVRECRRQPAGACVDARYCPSEVR